VQINYFRGNIKKNIYYKRLALLKLKYLFLFLGLFMVIFMFQIILMYIKIIPGILAPVKEMVTPATINWLQSGFNRFIVEIYFWGFLFFSVTIMLAYTLWNINKFLQVLDKELLNNDHSSDKK
jgi:hypothetical protein